jgi:hypothetical protein
MDSRSWLSFANLTVRPVEYDAQHHEQRRREIVLLRS